MKSVTILVVISYIQCEKHKEAKTPLSYMTQSQGIAWGPRKVFRYFSLTFLLLPWSNFPHATNSQHERGPRSPSDSSFLFGSIQ